MQTSIANIAVPVTLDFPSLRQSDILKKHKHAAYNIHNEQPVVHTEKHIKYRQGYP